MSRGLMPARCEPTTLFANHFLLSSVLSVSSVVHTTNHFSFASPRAKMLAT